MSELYQILDPRPIATRATKYTYFLPPPERIAAVSESDLVKVTMRPIPPSDKWEAERVWVKVLSATTDWLEGTLENEPFDMPLIVKGATIRIPRTHIVAVIFQNPDIEATLPIDNRRQFWERCLVDQAVLDGMLPVHAVWREHPDLTKPDDEFTDSGWRIRGDMRGATEEQLRERKFAYVALGAVLNNDDSWIDLIDEPVGADYEKDFDRGVFVRLREQS